VTHVRQQSNPINGPDCGDFIIYDSGLISDDPIANFHPTVMEVDRSLQNARVAGTGSFFDFFHGIQRDMAFDIHWEAINEVKESHSREVFEENGEIVTINTLNLERVAVAEGFVKECDNEFDGPVDGLCTPEDLASAPNLISMPSDPALTNIFWLVSTACSRQEQHQPYGSKSCRSCKQ
jgi:hypothetical protein